MFVLSGGQMKMNSLDHKSLAERAANDKKSSASAFPLESKKKVSRAFLLLSFSKVKEDYNYYEEKKNKSYHQNLWPIVSKLERTSGSIHTSERRIPRTIFFLGHRCWRSSWCWQALSLGLQNYRAKSALLHSHWKDEKPEVDKRYMTYKPPITEIVFVSKARIPSYVSVYVVLTQNWLLSR